MTEIEQRLLSVIQDAFPLEERPYRRLAEVLNAQEACAGGDARGHLTEQSVFDAVENLRRSGIVRRIGGIYDSHRLGFISRLCAGKVTDLDKFASAVNGIPAITHNYVRSHEYNVWFTAIAESEGEIRAIVDGLCASTGLHDVHILIATKKFKINTVMRVLKENEDSRLRENVDRGGEFIAALSSSDKARIRIACDDIPHTLTPFTDWGVSLEALRDDLVQKRMRRFGAILRHQDAGFAYNAMVCFKLDERLETKDERSVILSDPWKGESKDPAGAILANKPYISHCYERPAFEGFPYTLYVMMHAQSAEELDAFIKDAAVSIGNPEYAVLHSVRELKKTSFRFFA
ncbi:Lrp/AsnC family transcriptional regulator [Fibrobacter sp. UWT3]|uniref:Lrp/AsnC family transcriptional regulator n=1 Tax=Fibrobacter sp. UWT3 TaxID=1896225 RepID=UPI000BE36F87|nr:Lrp/AsnC family transcriptional regulator [Fibrobacter sp. UWT3]